MNPRITSATTLLQVDKKIETMQHFATGNCRSCQIQKRGKDSSSIKKQLTKQVIPLISKAGSKSQRAAEVIERLERIKKAKNLQVTSTSSKKRAQAKAMEMLARARTVEAQAEKKLQDILLKEDMMEKASYKESQKGHCYT